MYDFKLSVTSTSILLDILLKLHVNMNLQRVFTHMHTKKKEKNITSMQAQLSQDCIDVTVNLKWYRFWICTN